MIETPSALWGGVVSEEYDFHLRATAHDREGYYVPRWDRAVSIVMRAATKQDAINKAAAALGPCGSRGDYWGFRLDRIERVGAVPDDAKETR